MLRVITLFHNFQFHHMSGHRNYGTFLFLLVLSGFSGTVKVRNSGLGPDPDLSAQKGPEKVRKWPLGLEFFEMLLVSLNTYYIYIYIGIFSHTGGISKNSGPSGQFRTFSGPFLALRSGPLRSHWNLIKPKSCLVWPVEAANGKCIFSSSENAI